MKRVGLGIMLIVMVTACSQLAAAEDFAITALGGFKGGVGFRLAGSVSNFAQGFPVSVEAGVTYISLDPGKSAEVRKIFINDATNGTPEKSGWIWGFHLDFLFPVRWLGLPNGQFYLGVRRSLFTGDFVYVGGNEDFEVTANAWGVGTGLRTTFPMSRMIGLTLTGGLDYYPNVSLSGHDTVYGPDGQNVNDREGYQYIDADNAVNQPKFQPIFMLGLTYKF
jgi:hypothetical protein